MDLKQIYCVCDVGWKGDRCQNATCPLNCTHGGVPNADCTSCVGCAGAWTGKLCDSWNSSITASQLLNELNSVANASLAALANLQAVNPIRGNIGWGVDIVTGSLTTLPVVQLTYTDPQKTWHGYRYPVEAVVVPLENPQPICDAAVFGLVSDYVGFVRNNVAQNGGRNGIYGSQFASVLNSFFNRQTTTPDDPALSITQLRYAIYKIQLPPKPTGLYSFDKYALRAIQALPPDYNSDTNKAVYRRFLELFGSSYTTSSDVGGMLELRSLWAQWITQAGFTPETLAQQALIDIGYVTGLCKQSQDLSPKYSANRMNDHPLLCLGGSPASCSNPPDWLQTVATDPVPLNYDTTSISTLVQDPSVRDSLEQAVSSWVQEQNSQWDATNLCPPRCAHAGSCGATQQTCQTCLPYAIGRSCIHCATGAAFGANNNNNSAVGATTAGRVLYRCYTGSDHFTSPDRNCEGARMEYALGGTSMVPGANQLSRCYSGHDHMDEINCGCPSPYHCEMNLGGLYPAPATGLHPLYRCRAGSDHFDSTDPACEGKVTEFLLGYLDDLCPNSATEFDPNANYFFDDQMMIATN